MKHHLKIYQKLLHMSWLSLLIYRSSLFNSIISSLIWSFFNVTAIIFLTGRSSFVYGWSRNDLIMLVASANIMLGLFYFIFSRNIQDMSTIISRGKLDSILLKPMDDQFSVSVWQASFASLSRLLFGIIVVTITAIIAHVVISPLIIILFIVLLAFGVSIQYSIWFSVITLTIWFPMLSNLNDMLYTTNDLSRFPPEIYRAGKEILYFLIFPFTLIVVVPVKLLLHKVTASNIIALIIVAGLFLFLSRRFFRFALRSYTSANG